MDYSHVLLHLFLIDNVGPGVISKLCAQWPMADLSAFYHFSAADFMKQGLTENQARHVVEGLADRKKLEGELMLIEQYKVRLITIGADDYPYLLKNIHLPPAVLYCWGAPLDDSEHCLALVGARKADRYCANVLDRLLPPLLASGWVTVSGGARGADSMAHQKTLEHGGRTVVVLGSGLLRAYPPENRHLFNTVIQSGGTVVSIFPMKASPLPGNFPARNRVIAGLSRGTLVLQAAERSGALITAEFALEQGREVLAVPGAVDHELSQGPHKLIKQGAQLVTCAQDVFDVFQFQPSHQIDLPFVSQKVELSEDQRVIYDACAIPRSIDELATLANLDHTAVHELLFNLQLDKIVEQNHAGLWHRII